MLIIETFHFKEAFLWISVSPVSKKVCGHGRRCSGCVGSLIGSKSLLLAAAVSLEPYTGFLRVQVQIHN